MMCVSKFFCVIRLQTDEARKLLRGIPVLPPQWRTNVVAFTDQEEKARVLLATSMDQRSITKPQGVLKMNTKVCAAFLGMGLTIAGAAHAEWDNSPYYNVTVDNRSGYPIDELYMSGVTDNNWHNDLLGSGSLWSGYRTTIRATLGHYDVKLVDSDGDKCVVNDVLIPGDRTLPITT